MKVRGTTTKRIVDRSDNVLTVDFTKEPDPPIPNPPFSGAMGAREQATDENAPEEGRSSRMCLG
jgi:hypothetical protein